MIEFNEDGLFMDEQAWPSDVACALWINQWMKKVISVQFSLRVFDLNGCLDSELL